MSKQLARDLRPLVGLLLLAWVLEILDQVFGLGLDRFGIVPRHLAGLTGILAAPLLHGDFGHLAVNTVPCAILGLLIALGERRVLLGLSFFIVLAGGALVWLFARSAYHIGASGLVSGYFGYLIVRGLSAHSLRAVLLALLTVVLYGGMIWGVLPTRSGVSWESHLFGLIAGGLAARTPPRRAP